MDLITILILGAIAAGLILYSVLPRSEGGKDVLKRRMEGRTTVDASATIKETARKSAKAELVRRATPVLSRLIMPVSDAEQTQLRLKLTQAGYRHRQATTIFLASKTVVMLVALLVAGTILPTAGFSLTAILGGLAFAAGVGFIAPGFVLGMQTNSRRDKLRRGLPDVLDLLVVSIESGLALDAGIKRVGEEMALVHPQLSEEFRIATTESQMGIPRSEALDNLATRCNLDEIRSLVSVISQAERFGTSVAKALRSQGEALRTKRRQEAEERAQKTAVKLMIPLVMFIFPAMGVVLAGPAGIRLMEAFAK